MQNGRDLPFTTIAINRHFKSYKTEERAWPNDNYFPKCWGKMDRNKECQKSSYYCPRSSIYCCSTVLDELLFTLVSSHGATEVVCQSLLNVTTLLGTRFGPHYFLLFRKVE